MVDGVYDVLFRQVLAMMLLTLSILRPAVADDQQLICPELDGKHVQVGGIVHSFERYQIEPQASPRTYFELINPDWQCKQTTVHISASDQMLCFEGQNVVVQGVYYGSKEFLSFFSVIEAKSVVCQ